MWSQICHVITFVAQKGDKQCKMKATYGLPGHTRYLTLQDAQQHMHALLWYFYHPSHTEGTTAHPT